MPGLRISLDARAEMLDAFDYLKSQRADLPKRLAALIRAGLHDIRDHPYRFPVIHGRFRKHRISPFKYALIYEVMDDKSVHVLAFWHMMRDDRRLRRRLS